MRVGPVRMSSPASPVDLQNMQCQPASADLRNVRVPRPSTLNRASGTRAAFIRQQRVPSPRKIALLAAWRLWPLLPQHLCLLFSIRTPAVSNTRLELSREKMMLSLMFGHSVADVLKNMLGCLSSRPRIAGASSGRGVPGQRDQARSKEEPGHWEHNNTLPLCISPR